MDKFLDRIQKFVVPLSEKISSIKFLRALAETMMILMPVTVVGSFACLFAFIDLAPWQNFLNANPTVRMSSVLDIKYYCTVCSSDFALSLC